MEEEFSEFCGGRCSHSHGRLAQVQGAGEQRGCPVVWRAGQDESTGARWQPQESSEDSLGKVPLEGWISKEADVQTMLDASSLMREELECYKQSLKEMKDGVKKPAQRGSSRALP